MNPSATPEQPVSTTPNVLPPAGVPVEAAPAAAEVSAAAPSGAPAPVAQPATPPPAAPTLSADDVAAALAATPPAAPTPIVMPTAAADQDVIEPEWVDKAEQVVAQTAGNPYAEEEAVENLQIDYLQKRYGHSVKKADQTDQAA